MMNKTCHSLPLRILQIGRRKRDININSNSRQIEIITTVNYKGTKKMIIMIRIKTALIRAVAFEPGLGE